MRLRTAFVSSSLLAGACLVIAPAARAADTDALVPNQRLTLHFDGYCDGMTLVVDQAHGVVYGSDTGCATGSTTPIHGVPGTVAGGRFAGQGVVLGSTPELDLNLLYVIRNNPRLWGVYDLWSGALLNSGTWSPGPPTAAAPAADGASAAPPSYRPN